ncbi:MAG TPA: NfeD family protein [Arenimonas sp.]|uniref:NfeD family protein n=1 Tax=Arenimonas sp. TaxID=1872635 RepID=UPI002D7FDB85|nr:NfeD family protein [Arenimonas sp.]HEU0154221.1 NfeD family protein [Arenimonas sp.]
MRTALIVWASLALVLMAAETLAPGVFLLWLGFAAAVMFLVMLGVPDLAPVWQATAFILLSFASIGLYVKFVRGREKPSQQPLLNRRGAQLVGQVFVLEQAIVDGRGRLKIGDAFWTAEGPDLAQGTRVRVVGADNMSLQVVAAD